MGAIKSVYRVLISVYTLGMREHTEPITFRASDALVEAIDRMAKENNITRAQMVHRAVSDRCGFGVTSGIVCTDPGIHRGKPIYPAEIVKTRTPKKVFGPSKIEECLPQLRALDAISPYARLAHAPGCKCTMCQGK